MTRVLTEAQKEAAAVRERRWREENPDRVREHSRAAYTRDRDKYIARARERERRLREEDAAAWRAEAAERAARWRTRNPEKVKAILKAHREAYPEQGVHFNRLRRAREAGAAGTFTLADVAARFAFHGHRCVYCGTTDELTIDHMIPLARGGSNWPANLVPACAPCNRRKHARTFMEFVAVCS